jgi:hypothetical protein
MRNNFMTRTLIVICTIFLTLNFASFAFADLVKLENPFDLAPKTIESQAADFTGKYIYKTYRKGKGGFENHLTITKAARDKVHISFEGTYFYMAGRDETFHEGSGEGDGQVNGNIVTATLSEEGGSGTCRITLTFNETLVTNEYTVTVKIKSAQCQLNVSPEGLYCKEAGSKRRTETSAFANTPPMVATPPSGFEVCPDPKAPCRSPPNEADIAFYASPIYISLLTE